jgi:hypothetical protein
MKKDKVDFLNQSEKNRENIEIYVIEIKYFQ